MELGWIENVIPLVILLIVVGPRRLMEMARGVWQIVSGKRKLRARDWRVVGFALVFPAGVLIVSSLESKGIITTKQMLVSLGVLIFWSLVWWYCFGKERD